MSCLGTGAGEGELGAASEEVPGPRAGVEKVSGRECLALGAEGKGGSVKRSPSPVAARKGGCLVLVARLVLGRGGRRRSGEEVMDARASRVAKGGVPGKGCCGPGASGVGLGQGEKAVGARLQSFRGGVRKGIC